MTEGKENTRIRDSSGNVFADLGLRDADKLDAKAALAVRVNQLTSKLTQRQAAERLGIAKPQVRQLRAYKLDAFSVDQLRAFLSK
jgi:predicted XRE-type DNA-binding protein